MAAVTPSAPTAGPAAPTLGRNMEFAKIGMAKLTAMAVVPFFGAGYAMLWQSKIQEEIDFREKYVNWLQNVDNVKTDGAKDHLTEYVTLIQAKNQLKVAVAVNCFVLFLFGLFTPCAMALRPLAFRAVCLAGMASYAMMNIGKALRNAEVVGQVKAWYETPAYEGSSVL